MKFLNKKFIIIIILFFIIICISIYFFTKDEEYEITAIDDFSVQNFENSTPDENVEIVIHIDGEVLNPGIVSLSPNSRISDAIEAAGGITQNADLSKINLAYMLQDGQKVYVPSFYDEEIEVYVSNSAGDASVLPESNSSSSLININSATATELETLPGVGPSTAQKIINHREKNGKFESIEEIMEVSGIGEAKFNSIKDFICI